MINARSISAYIDFLYRQKYGTAAPAEVLSSWAPLPDAEIPQHLAALYEHWGLSPAEANRYEQAFQAQVAAAATTPYAPPVYTPPAYAPQASVPPPPVTAQTTKRNTGNPWKVFAVVLVILVLGAGGILAYQWYAGKEHDSDNNQGFGPTTTTTVPDQPAPVVNKPQPEPMVAGLPIDAEDEQNIRVIQELLTAEDNQDMNQALNYYAPYMEHYWDISYPTRDQLENRYSDVWSKVSDPHNRVNSIQKVAPNAYDANLTYSYFSIKNQVKKTVKSTVRFVLNSDHQVVEVYGLK